MTAVRLARFESGVRPGVERLVYDVLFPALLFRALAGAPVALLISTGTIDAAVPLPMGLALAR